MTDLPDNLRPDQKAEVLIQVLPWLQRFAGTRVVIKYGGHAMVDERLQRAFAAVIQFLHQVGMQPIVVHGGGPQISAMLDRLVIAAEFRGGRRVTAPEAIKVVRMVLTGQVHRDLVSLLNEQSANAGGISAKDGGLLRPRRRTAVVDAEPVDI